MFLSITLTSYVCAVCSGRTKRSYSIYPELKLLVFQSFQSRLHKKPQLKASEKINLHVSHLMTKNVTRMRQPVRLFLEERIFLEKDLPIC